jgi:UDP-2,3-diacylglucosamine pyrophosphatase LpxH
MRRLIISDLHIGSFFSREKDILSLLKTEKYEELILAGDIIDFIRIPKPTTITIEIFKKL